MTEDKNSSYSSILKSTTLFGGVQAFQILIKIVSTKLISVLLGPFGVGVSNLLSSGLDMVGSVTSLGVAKSCVRDISLAHSSADEERVSKTISSLRQVVLWTGLLGMLSVLILCRPLSRWGFGNFDYSLAFAVLSIKMLISQILAGQNSILQGVRRLKDLAAVSVICPVVGLMISVPLYYFYGVKGIVPSMLIGSAVCLAVNTYYARRVKVNIVRLPLKEVFRHTSHLLGMGVAFTVAAFLSNAAMFVLKGIISKDGGPETVGLFSSGFSLTNTYVAMIFTAIGTDYYPRLAAAGNNQQEACGIVNRQGEVGILFLMPILAVGIFFTPIILRLFYSARFLASSDYVLYAVPGLVFKFASFLIVYQMIARGDSVCYIINEIVATCISLALDIFAFNYSGITGLGVSCTVGYFLYFLQVFTVTRIRYGFVFSAGFLKLFGGAVAVVSICLFLRMILKGVTVYFAGGFFLLALTALSLYGLNARIGLINKFRSVWSRKR